MSEGENHAGEPLVDAVRTWLRERVVGLGLCPYAAGPLAAGRVRLAVAPGDLEARLTAVYLEAERLLAADPASCETTLVLLPDAPPSFLDFYDETELAERLVEQAVGEELQVVTFHPRFRFADADPADPANGVNRAPVALWQLLREASVARVVEADPDRVEAIPGRNRDLLRHLVAEVGRADAGVKSSLALPMGMASGGPMERLDDWHDDAQTHSRERFCATHAHPVLLLRWVVKGELGAAARGQSTHVHNVRASLKDRLAAGNQVPERRPIGQERLLAIRREAVSPRPGVFVLGRHADSDVCVNDYTVSSRHGRLHFMKRIGRWMFEDTDSTNGSWINGSRVPVRERALIASTDELQLGRLVFLFLGPQDLHRYLLGDY